MRTALTSAVFAGLSALTLIGTLIADALSATATAEDRLRSGAHRVPSARRALWSIRSRGPSAFLVCVRTHPPHPDM